MSKSSYDRKIEDLLDELIKKGVGTIWDTDDVYQQELYRKNQGKFLIVPLDAALGKEPNE